MKRKHPKHEQRLPLCPAAQLRNVIDGVCDESLEAEAIVEDVIEADSSELSQAQAQLEGAKTRVGLTEFATEYANRLRTNRLYVVNTDSELGEPQRPHESIEVTHRPDASKKPPRF
jgi:hypothetical protein